MRSPARFAGLAIATAACSALGVALLKAGLHHGPIAWAPLAAGIGLYVVGIACGLLLLARHPVSIAYPAVVGLALAALAVLSSLWLGEPIDVAKAAGTVLIVAGVYLLATGDRDRVGGEAGTTP